MRAFLQANVPAISPPGLVAVHEAESFEAARELNYKLGAQGWIAPAWPKEYGGLGASIYEQVIFSEEFWYHGVPDTGTRVIGVGMIGPTLIIHGSDAQKAKCLHRITSGEDIWCQQRHEWGAITNGLSQRVEAHAAGARRPSGSRVMPARSGELVPALTAVERNGATSSAPA